MKNLLHMLYPPQCLTCRTKVVEDFGLCGPCWSSLHFMGETICKTCGDELLGPGDTEPLYCEMCLKHPRIWHSGRTVLRYCGAAKPFLFALKYGNREEYFRPAAQWMRAHATELVHDDTMLVPIPLHWTRLIRRRYNQAAGIARWLGPLIDRPVLLDGLVRIRSTTVQKNMTITERHENLLEAIRVKPRHREKLANRSVLLIDDVMTSGATFSAATKACLEAGVTSVKILALARATLNL